MVGIVRVALERPYTFVVAAILVLIFGTMSAVRTPKDIFPNIGIPVISVIWTYSGLSPEDMSNRIVYVYERALTSTVNDIEHIESQSVPGYGILKIFFQPQVNIAAAQSQVTSISQTILKQLPAGITPPQLVIFNASSVPILQLAVSSPTASQVEMNDLSVNFIRPPLTTVPGAALPYPYGGQVRQIQVDLDQKALHSYGLSAQDVVSALSAQNLINPVGTEKIGKYEYTVNLNDSPDVISDFNNLPIKVVNGTIVYMRDVAFVHNGSPPQTNVVQLNGHKGVLMSILKTGSASTLDIIDGIKSLLPRIRETLPAGMELKTLNDQSSFVRASVNAVIREGLIAAGLTGLMILLFLGSWRSTLIITVSIPLSIFAALAVLSALGETINVMTLGGFALAVGMLVDEATVTIENINWHLEHGKPIKTAILDGANQIVVAATLSLLCICIVFVPMFTLGGVAGYLFRPLAEAVVFAMFASYLWSRTLVPTMALYLLRNVHHGHSAAAHGKRGNFLQRFQQGFERGFERFRSAYVGLLRLALRHRRIAVSLFLVVPVLCFLLVPYLGENFFPEVDSGSIKLHVRPPANTRIEEATRIVDQVEGEIRKVIPPNVLLNVVDDIGLSNSGINKAYDNSGFIGNMDADIFLSLNEEDRAPAAEYVKTLREILPRKFPEVTFSFLPADMVSQILNFGSPAPIDVQITGPDMVQNRELAAKLLAKIAHVPGIADPRIQQAFQAPALNVTLDRTLAGMVGYTERDAVNAMQNSLAGSSQTTPTYWVDPKNGVSYAVSVQTPQYQMDTLQELRNMPLTSASGSDKPSQLLGGLAKITPGPTPAVVSHYNIRPAIDIFATTQGRDLGGVNADIEKILADTRAEWGKGVRVDIRGQVTTMKSAYNELFVGLAFAIVLIYLLIVVNFQSWLDPFIVVMALPTALAGIIWMLFTTGTTLSVPALTGAIMCMGVATANSILVISFARERLAAGVDSVTAAIESGETRIRPVMMTALAMIIGMVPMAIEPGQNAPLGRAVIGGLMFATCATLFFVPTLFSIFHRNDHKKAKVDADESDPALPSLV